ncbi:MAG: S46 family peptidase, partial [Parafilimonas sp.]
SPCCRWRAGTERIKKLNDIAATIQKEAVGNDEFKAAVLTSIFKGRQYLLYVYDVYKDLRLVGSPPESIGKFGGDTDNWEWPRHTGDFSVFRVYMSADGKAANYSTSNVSLKPKYFLPVSNKGFRDGDYAMIFGYPGGTNRYETSYGVKLSTDINNPALVKLRDMRLKYMFAEMENDPAIKLQLASEYAGVANYWKFFEGETKELLKYDIYGQKKKSEDAFVAWANGKQDYQNIFSDYAKAYDAWRPYAMHRVYITEGINGCRLIQAASGWQNLEIALKGNDTAAVSKALQAADDARKAYHDNYNLKADQNILASALIIFLSDIDASQQPKGFYDDLFKKYNSIDENPFKAYAADVFTNTMMNDDKKWNGFKQHPTVEAFQADPAYQVVIAFIKNYNDNYAPKYNEFVAKTNDLGRMYMKGLFEMNPDKMNKTYPDANFTMRVSYGNVKSYHPRDAVMYDYACTLTGVMDKYKPGDYEFDLPQKFIDLYNAHDFGRYADPLRNDIVVTFITTNDITGGNSGSPVMNGKGELIGLAFDGNYEALSHKMAFDKDLNRTICVDVRYVLWCIDKLGGGKSIVDELKIMQ